MIVWKVADPLTGTECPVALEPITEDWWGRPLEPAPGVALVEDPGHLWLVAGHDRPARPHPSGRCGDVVEGLWEFDVAECFIAGPRGYLEFNLSPAGAWWCARFSAPRVRDPGMPQPAVVTRVDGDASGGGWRAALGIPLAVLRDEVGWPDRSTINVTMIIGAPQRFLSAADLGGGDPDFHRPEAFEPAEPREA